MKTALTKRSVCGSLRGCELTQAGGSMLDLSQSIGCFDIINNVVGVEVWVQLSHSQLLKKMKFEE